MKYEMIFGDEKLFFDAQQDCEMVGNGHHKVENGKLMVWNFSEKYWAESHTNKITIAAMRRIIKDPKRWTLEDKKAGRLPEVGSKLICTETWDAFEFVGVIAGSMRWACKDFQDGFLYFFEQSEMSPIESPEENAARLRSEWCNRAMDYSTIQQLYYAMLSGELAVPVAPEQNK